MMDPDQAQKLRAPFKPEQIGKLPRNIKDKQTGKVIKTIHLDYVGHAAITDRLLQVDPEWTWEPMAVDANGFPLLDTKGGLWILLTVGGVTRPGYGDETNGQGMKEIIGDALRNAAMRFGVGLDLWSKEDLGADEDGRDHAPNKTGPAEDVVGRASAQEGSAAGKPAGVGGASTEYVFDFGKHSGTPISGVPRGYLEWLVKSDPNTEKAKVAKRAAIAFLAKTGPESLGQVPLVDGASTSGPVSDSASAGEEVAADPRDAAADGDAGLTTDSALSPTPRPNGDSAPHGGASTSTGPGDDSLLGAAGADDDRIIDAGEVAELYAYAEQHKVSPVIVDEALGDGLGQLTVAQARRVCETIQKEAA